MAIRAFGSNLRYRFRIESPNARREAYRGLWFGWLSGFHRFPIRLMEEIEGRRDTLLKILNGTGVRVLPAVQGSFLTIEGRRPCCSKSTVS
jgi:hypothetical protein